MPRPVSSPPPLTSLQEGDWLDVMDLDGIWSVARVLSIPSSDEVEITYDGWPSDYDEVVSIDCDRVAPYHTYTWAVKCWVKHSNWPMWPSIVTIRSPGTEAGARNLKKENKLQVDFMDSSNFSKRTTCWLFKGQVKPFHEKQDERRMATNGSQFEQAYGFVLQSDTEEELPKFVPRGTLPLRFKDAVAESVEMKRRELGDAEWFARFGKNQKLHQKTHQYAVLGDDGDVVSVESVTVANLEMEDKPDKKQKSAKAQTAKAKTAKVSTVSKRQTKAAARRVKTPVEREEAKIKPKRPKLSTVARDEIVPSTEDEEENEEEEDEEEEEGEEEAPKSKRPKLSTATGNGKAPRKMKRTKMITVVSRPSSNNRRLLCVRK
ncbi:hypothetical protein P3T76_013542 [Phytophthora citrophthora]|uniref:PWWP domain-containing protein n=1 Tax=Phytophthora citrophthora TaxID=4793 RepID=A0AAD9LBX2_9STRA|nr:hypothetical protein P3T76_013542 [Phytophthora citrophthora]